MKVSVRTLAIHQPQLQPVAEDDAWWGKGFTEWTKVSRAARLFPVHERPRVPGDLGYAEMRVPEARALAVHREAVLRELGCDVYLVGVEGHRAAEDLCGHGFDHALNFRPQTGAVPASSTHGSC